MTDLNGDGAVTTEDPTVDETTMDAYELTKRRMVQRRAAEPSKPARSRAKPSGGAYAAVLAETLRPLSTREAALVLSTLAQMPPTGPEGGTARITGQLTASTILSVLNGVSGLCEAAGNVTAVRTVLRAMATLIDAAREVDAHTVALQHEAIAAMLQVDRAEEAPERRAKK